MERYSNREEAGKILAEQLRQYENDPNTLVLALPRGGVPVAYEIARALHLPLDIFIVRKLGVPGHSEFAFGAIAANGVRVFNEDAIRDCHVSPEAIQAVTDSEMKELTRRESVYRGNHVFPVIKDRNIILVDDGVATGASLRAAIQALKKFQLAKLIVAVPVIDKSLYAMISELVDQFVCPLQVSYLQAVGSWYDDFAQTEDEEVFRLLKAARTLL